MFISGVEAPGHFENLPNKERQFRQLTGLTSTLLGNQGTLHHARLDSSFCDPSVHDIFCFPFLFLDFFLFFSHH